MCSAAELLGHSFRLGLSHAHAHARTDIKKQDALSLNPNELEEEMERRGLKAQGFFTDDARFGATDSTGTKPPNGQQTCLVITNGRTGTYTRTCTHALPQGSTSRVR